MTLLHQVWGQEKKNYWRESNPQLIITWHMINMISMSLTTELQSHTDIETLSEYHMLAAGKEQRTKKEDVWHVGVGRRGPAQPMVSKSTRWTKSLILNAEGVHGNFLSDKPGMAHNVTSGSCLPSWPTAKLLTAGMSCVVMGQMLSSFEVFTLPHLFWPESDRSPSFPVGLLGIWPNSNWIICQPNWHEMAGSEWFLSESDPT